MAVVKVTQHLCQKQLQSSSLSCSFIITHTRTHTLRYTRTRTHTDAHSNTHATASAWKSFHFFPFYLTGLPEKLVEQIFMKILCSSFIFCVSLFLSMLSISFSAQTITKVTSNIIFGLLLVARTTRPLPAHWLLPLPRHNDCELAFVCFFLVLKPIPACRAKEKWSGWGDGELSRKPPFACQFL